MEHKQSVLAINFSAPELGHLAAEFARRGQLLGYVMRYANQHRAWEQFLERVPAAGALYWSTLGRRRIPDGLSARDLAEAGVASDFLACLVARLGVLGRYASILSVRLHQRTIAAIARRGAGLAQRASLLIAGSGTALPAFRSARAHGARRVLNYPSAHHRFQQRFFAAAAERQPEFAGLSEGPSQISSADERDLDEECDLAELILTGSQFARDSFVTQGYSSTKVRAIPYGVDLQRFTPGPARRATRRFRITYVGRISSRKGIGYLLQAYQRFRKPDTDLDLVGNIVGDARCLRPYAGLFTHTPHLPQSKLPEVYRATDVFVFPSLLEGLGLVVLEAMACGCPVIVSTNGPCDVVRDGVDGIVIPAENAQALEAALERVYRDRELLAALASAARAGAEAHSWAHYASSASQAVLELASHAAARRD